MRLAAVVALFVGATFASDVRISVTDKGKVKIKGATKDAVILRLLRQQSELAEDRAILAQALVSCLGNAAPEKSVLAQFGTVSEPGCPQGPQIDPPYRPAQYSNMDRWIDFVQRQKAEALLHPGDSSQRERAAQFSADLRGLGKAYTRFTESLGYGQFDMKLWRDFSASATKFSSCKVSQNPNK